MNLLIFSFEKGRDRLKSSIYNNSKKNHFKLIIILLTFDIRNFYVTFYYCNHEIVRVIVNFFTHTNVHICRKEITKLKKKIGTCSRIHLFVMNRVYKYSKWK